MALVPGAEEGSISVVTDRRHVSSQVPTGQLPQLVDDLQNQTGQGCLDAAYEHQTVRVNNLATAERWPEFAHRAAQEAGVASMLAFHLFVEGNNLGALNLFSRRPDAFTDESEHVGLLFAAHAAIAFADAQKQDQLAEAIRSRDLTGQAKGILMERYKITAEQAFLMLARTSQDTNRKLHQLAAELATSGELTGHTDTPPR